MTVAVEALEAARIAKARGAFYTPRELTDFLAGWAVRDPADTVLEPSAGDGAFLPSLIERLTALGAPNPIEQITAVERDEAEARTTRLLAPGVDVRAVDFFDLDPSTTARVSAVVGNPPYIRFHGFQGADRAKALARTESQGIQLTGLASSWAHFVVHATAFLADSGRLALVLPAELLHTDYAGPVRSLLSRRFRSVTLVAFDRAVFRSAQVDAVLLLASDDGPAGFRVIRVADEIALANLDVSLAPDAAVGSERWSGSVDSEAGRIYAEAIASGLGRRLGEFAHVDIGFVSGANDFFVLTRHEAEAHGLPPELLIPTVRRPSDVPGLIVRDEELRFLLHIPKDHEPDATTRRYLRMGVERGIDQRYKCRKRTPWYSVPLPTRMPDAFLPYMQHLGPRLIVNRPSARNSNLLHGVSLKPGAPSAESLAIAMSSSLTLLSAEIEGRAYGGGVLKLETKEAERLLVPRLGDSGSLRPVLAEIDAQIRAGGAQAAAAIVDGLLAHSSDKLWSHCVSLRSRRLGRPRGPK